MFDLPQQARKPPQRLVHLVSRIKRGVVGLQPSRFVIGLYGVPLQTQRPPIRLVLAVPSHRLFLEVPSYEFFALLQMPQVTVQPLRLLVLFVPLCKPQMVQ